MENNRVELNRQFCQMLKGGVIMDVTTPEQAKIAEAAGACAVMALERIPADIRAAGGVSRMSDPKMMVFAAELYKPVRVVDPAPLACDMKCGKIKQVSHTNHSPAPPALRAAPVSFSYDFYTSAESWFTARLYPSGAFARFVSTPSSAKQRQLPASTAASSMTRTKHCVSSFRLN